MSETLKFGNGKWAVKEGSALAYNDENGNFKPLPFDFTRASTATYVAEDGLIKTAAIGEPRIDFLDNSEGSLKLEPQRTNLITYSEDFSQSVWALYSSGNGEVPIVTSNYATSPDGTENATRLQLNINGGTSSIDRSFIRYSSFSSQTDYYYSCYIKSANGQEQKLLWQHGGDSNEFTVTTEWQRVKFDRNGFAETFAGFSLRGGISTVDSADVLVWGFQVEQGSYPTSYIPTQGSSVTRVQDACSQTVPDGIIGQTEGTLYADVNFVGVTEAITNQIFFVREQGSNNGYLFAGFYQGKLNCGMKVSGSLLFDSYFSGVLTKGRYKIAVAYKSGDTKIYINGIQTGFKNNSFGVNNFAQIFLSGFAGTNQLGDINRNFKLYNTRLTDQELQTLTTL